MVKYHLQLTLGLITCDTSKRLKSIYMYYPNRFYLPAYERSAPDFTSLKTSYKLVSKGVVEANREWSGISLIIHDWL